VAGRFCPVLSGGRRVEPFGRLGNHRFFLLHCGVPGNKSGWICCKVGREQGRSWGLQRDMPKDRHGNTCVLWSCGEIRPARRDQEQQAPRKVRLPNVLFACSIRVDFPPPRRNLLAREHLPPGTPSPRSEERGLCRSHTPQLLRHPTGPQIRILALDDFPKTTFGFPWQAIPPRFAVTF
jgi:hypothetical protein